MYVAVWKCPDTVDNGIARLLFGSSFCFLHPLGSWRSNLERDSACAKDREICQAAFGKVQRGIAYFRQQVQAAIESRLHDAVARGLSLRMPSQHVNFRVLTSLLSPALEG
ncbi:unnamed protein product [Effrenium voratum]|nr:unnamed protein product [Effrenium voratum]